MEKFEIIELAAKKINATAWLHYGSIRLTLSSGRILEGINNILFDHDFAKAFWGNEKYTWCGFNKETHGDFEDECWCNAHQENFLNNPLAWQYHLQKMVLEENPVKYIESFL